jgi:hypothetical protein
LGRFQKKVRSKEQNNFRVGDYYLGVANALTPTQPQQFLGKIDFYRKVGVSYRRGEQLLARGVFKVAAIVGRSPLFSAEPDVLSEVRVIVKNLYG